MNRCLLNKSFKGSFPISLAVARAECLKRKTGLIFEQPSREIAELLFVECYIRIGRKYVVERLLVLEEQEKRAPVLSFARIIGVLKSQFDDVKGRNIAHRLSVAKNIKILASLKYLVEKPHNVLTRRLRQVLRTKSVNVTCVKHASLMYQP